jgi:hypothetical protein
MGDAAPLVIDDTVIARASGQDQSPDWEVRFHNHIGDLKLRAGLGEFQQPAATLHVLHPERLPLERFGLRYSPDHNDFGAFVS